MPSCATQVGVEKMTGAVVLAVVFALVCVKLAEAQLQLPKNSCEFWSQYNAATNSCECGSRIHNIVFCKTINGSLSVSVLHGYCMTLNNKTKKAVVGACPYNYRRRSHPPWNYVPLSRDQKNDYCSEFNRTGRLCGECIHGNSPPVYSYYTRCVRCTTGTNNWPKYLAVSLLPTTIFYLTVIVFKFRATSPQMNGYILTVQLCMSLNKLRGVIRENKNVKNVWDKILNYYFSSLSVWNLEFFRELYSPFCLHPNASTLYVLSLDYITAVYPLILIFITYTLVRLHYNNCRLVVWLWKPFISCFARCRRQWDMQNSLVDAFATFLLLSYVKFLSISFDLLTPTIMWDSKGRVQGIALYYDGTVDYNQHLPYVFLALTFLVVFTFLPILLLCLYPCRCFQRLMNRLHWQSQMLHYFMDCFQGCFKDGTDGSVDCRYFAALYLVIRIVMYVGFMVTNNVFNTVIQTATLLLAIVLLSCFQPYKKQIYNKIDVVFLATLCIIINADWNLHDINVDTIATPISRFFLWLLSPIPFIYPIFLILYYTIRKCKTACNKQGISFGLK